MSEITYEYRILLFNDTKEEEEEEEEKKRNKFKLKCLTQMTKINNICIQVEKPRNLNCINLINGLMNKEKKYENFN